MKIPKWKTKDGKVMEIHEMDDNHLLNAQRMCRKTVCDFNDMVRCSNHPVFAPRGDGAQMAFEQELDALYDLATVHKYMESFLDKEVKKRGLKPLDLPAPLNLPEIEEVHELEHGTIFKLKQKEEKEMTKDYEVLKEFYVAGVQFHELKNIINDLSVDDHFELVLEPSNKYDPNAVRIEHFKFDEGETTMCGYVPKKFSAEVNALICIGTPLDCVITELNRNAKPWEQCKVEIREVK